MPLKAVIILCVGIAVVAASYFFARNMTLKELTDQNVIFDTFEQVDASWLYSDRIGIPAASDLERARVAIAGPLGLSAKEAVYFVAPRDKDGEHLRSHCSYRVSGGSIDARWWSITLYDSETQHYVPNDQNRSSWNSVNIPRLEEDAWLIQVGSQGADEPSLHAPRERDRPFELMLRIYNPSEATRSTLPRIELPVIERIKC